MENTAKKVTYATPAVLDHGSISDNTFLQGNVCRIFPRLPICRTVPAPGLSSTF